MTQKSHEKQSEYKKERRPRQDNYTERCSRRYKKNYFKQVDDNNAEEELDFNDE